MSSGTPVDPFAESTPKTPARRRLLEHPIFHLALLASTFVTTTLAGGAAFTAGGGPLRGGRFSDGFAFSLPLLLILGIHELGHYAMCRHYGLAATLPYFLPSPFINLIGTFGALIRIKEPIRQKRVLLDVGAAGPLAGFVAALPFLFYGVAHPRPTSTPLQSGTILFDYPLIVRLAQRWTHVAPYTSAAVHEHPTFMAAWFGLFVTCLNLLPLGQLDGGHVLRAAAGRRQPMVSAVVLALAVVAGILGSAVWAVFAVVVVAIMGIAHPPVEDDDRALDFSRQLVALLCIGVFLLCFSLAPIRTT
ncbi:MAG TPA: site-2 protease family protein [Thermoanaerobaculia bacterium]|jgi:membrane-associated protease RseP (regulator of RpoE activity)